jgi:hypothetical protein
MHIRSLVVSLSFLILAASCSGGSSGGGGSNAFQPPPDTITFAELAATGGVSFTIAGVPYTIFGAQIKRLNGDVFEVVLEATVGTIDCITTYNVEVAGGKAYILGGQKVTGGNCPDETGASARVWEYDPDGNTLAEVASMNNPREVFGSGVVDGKIYVLGGWDPAGGGPGQNETTVEVFEDGVWSIVDYTGDYLVVRSPAYAAAGNNIYLFGGCIEEGQACPCTTQYTQIFDTTTNTFSQGAEMVLSGRHFSGQHTAVRDDRYIYVFGGSIDFSCEIYNDIGVYDVQADEWELSESTMLIERKSCGSTLAGDELYIFGGLRCDPQGQCTGLTTCTGGDPGCAKVGAGTNEVGTFVSAE